MTILVDNFDPRKHDENSEMKLKHALEWEKEFVSFMHNYVEKNNRSHLFDLAFNSGIKKCHCNHIFIIEAEAINNRIAVYIFSERSIEDELERETSGDILTVAISYSIMFLYIILALGRITR